MMYYNSRVIFANDILNSVPQIDSKRHITLISQPKYFQLHAPFDFQNKVFANGTGSQLIIVSVN